MAFGDIQKIELIDLPKDFESVNVANGFEYQFNLKPIGQINLVGKSGTMQINYGKINSEIWLVGTKKVPLSTAAPPENIYNITVDTILGGKFSGYCFYTS